MLTRRVILKGVTAAILAPLGLIKQEEVPLYKAGTPIPLMWDGRYYKDIRGRLCGGYRLSKELKDDVVLNMNKIWEEQLNEAFS